MNRNLLNKISKILIQKKIINFIKILFLLIALYFFYFQFKEIELRNYMNLPISGFFLSLVSVFIGTSLFAYSWFLNLKNSKLDLIVILKYYFQGQLGKYIPGSIWSVAGRVALATQAGVPPKLASKITIKHVIKLWLVCLIIGVVFYFSNIYLSTILIAIMVISGLKFSEIYVYTLGWFFIGLSYLIAAKIILFEFEIYKLFASGLLSWFGGFIFIPAPSGLAVREYLFNYFYSEPNFFEHLLIISGIIRLVSILNDVFGFIFYTLLDKVRREKNEYY